MDWKDFATREWDKHRVDFRLSFVDVAGDLMAGLLLSQITYWFLPDREGKRKLRVEKNGRYWLVKGRDDWWDECRMTVEQYDRAIVILKDKGLVETEVHLFNAKSLTHIWLNESRFTDLLTQVNTLLSLGLREKKYWDKPVRDRLGETPNRSETDWVKPLIPTLGETPNALTENTTETTYVTNVTSCDSTSTSVEELSEEEIDEILKETSASKKGRLKRSVGSNAPDSRVASLLARVRSYASAMPEYAGVDPIQSYGQECAGIKRILNRGFSEDEIFNAWKALVDKKHEYVGMQLVGRAIKKEAKHEDVWLYR